MDAKFRLQSAGLSGFADIPRSAWNKLIDEWIFSERDREILKRRFLDGITFEDLANEFELSVRQTKSIVKKGLDALIKHI